MAATNPKRRRLLKRLVIALLGLLLCGGIGVGVFIYAMSLMGEAISLVNSNNCPASEPDKVESMALFKLPPSGNLIFSLCGGMQGTLVEAHFEMKPDDLKTFLATTSVANLSTSDKPEELYCTCDQDVVTVGNYLYGIYESPEWLEEVFIDTTNPNRYIVYFTVLAG